MAAAHYLPPTRRPRLRYTIGGLLAWTLIISVGLARWRLPNATLLGACLASLTAWLMANLASSLQAAWLGARQVRPMTREAQWSLGLDIGTSLAGMVVCIVIIGSGFASWKPATMTTANELLGCFWRPLAFCGPLLCCSTRA
jgi:hypothetical protein